MSLLAQSVLLHYKSTRYQSSSQCLEEEIAAWYVLARKSILN